MDNIAIVVIEFQKSWTDKGFFNRLIKKSLLKRNVIENTINLLNKSRNKGLKIIQAPLYIDKKDKNYKRMPFPARLFKQLTKGTWKAEFTQGIYKKSDLIALGRYGFDATKGSDLLQILKTNNIKKVYTVGFTTDHCVKETMNTLIKKGFECAIVSDCTAARNNKLQQKTENLFDTITSKKLLEQLF